MGGRKYIAEPVNHNLVVCHKRPYLTLAERRPGLLDSLAKQGENGSRLRHVFETAAGRGLND